MALKGWTKPLVIEMVDYDNSYSQNVKELTKDDIDELHNNLASSYQCDIATIDYDFEKVTDVDDEDYNDTVRLVFYMGAREIFNIKMAIPEELKQMALFLKPNVTN